MPKQTPEEVERMISAYLDGELTQAESQRVRLLIEDHPDYQKAYEEMRQLQQLTHAMPMPHPPEERIFEIERRISVVAPRRVGFYALWGGLAMWLVYLVVLFFRHLRMPTPGETIASVFVFGLVSLFVSVAVQRWQELPHDRYRRIRK
jgi:anti-sigma factor RsiW